MRRRGRRWVAAGLVCAFVACVGTSASNRIVRWVGDAAGHPVPILPAPLFHTLASDPLVDESATPATPAARRVISTLARVQGRERHTRYQHRTHVREALGEYFWDCSGLVNWVLRRASPRALRSLGRDRPVAMTYARMLARSPTASSRHGWQRIAHVREVRPGDVFAWQSPQRFRRHATGHVGFIVSAPAQVGDDFWALRILDSTVGPHQDDTRPWDDVGGTGKGTMTFQTDRDGHVVGYGWWGTQSPLYVAEEVLFGRLH